MSMNRIFQPGATALLFRLTDGAERYQKSTGHFRVVHGKKQQKNFPTLLDAFLYYIALDDDADLLDADHNDALIERKVRLSLN